MTGTLCQCHGRYGYTQLQGTDDYVCAGCHLPAPGYEAKKTGIVFFRGGPLDGKAYNTTDISELAKTQPIGQYHWTPEKITSPHTGRVARVWNWSGEAAPQETTPTEGKETPTMQNTTADGVTNTQLLERRKALGLSRSIVASEAGITQSQLGSMETSGKRVKEGVMDKVHAVLTKYESQRESAGDAKESHTPEV